MLLLILFACAEPSADTASPRAPAADLSRDAVRVSLALRGVLPEPADLEVARAGGLEILIEDWLAGDDFLATVRDLEGRALGLGDDRAGVGLAVELHASLHRAPVEQIAAVVAEGRPYREIMVGGTRVDPLLASLWGLPYSDAGSTWQGADWRDGRPAAGLLSDGSLHLALGGTDVHRAAMLARYLVCDALDAPADGTASCEACHATLDPLAVLWAPQLEASEGTAPLVGWDPTVSAAGVSWRTPVADLPALSEQIGSDRRFLDCAVERYGSDLVGTALARADRDALVADLAEDQDVRRIAGRIVGDHLATAPPIPMDPHRFTRLVERLTGYVWAVETDEGGTIDGATSAAWGTRTLWEGPSRPWAIRHLSEQAAGYAVTQPSPLFSEGLPVLPPEVDAKLAELHARILGELEPDLDPTRALWEEVAATSGLSPAWAAVVAAMLQTLETR